eukprot:242645_1
MAQEQVTLVIWISIISLSLIFGLVQVYALYGFYSIQHLVIIRKRYPKLVIIEAITVILLCIVVTPFWYNTLLNAIHFNTLQPINLIGYITIAPANHLIANAEACRLWLMSFNLHYLHSSKNSKWKSEIDHTFAAKNWYLTNKNKYGNRNYVISRVLIYYIIAASIATVSFLYFQLDRLHLSELIAGLFFSVPVCITIYTYYKCPKHHESNDNFYFHYEIKSITFIYLTCFIFYFISTLVQYLGFNLVHIMCLLLITIIGVLLPSLVSTLWIPRKILLNRTWRGHLTPVPSNSVTTKTQTSVNLHEKDEITSTEPLERLRMIFDDEATFESFVHWMYREFSNETILCFIEFVQFKQYLITIMDEPVQCEYKLYDNVPKSSIVYSQFNDEDQGRRYKSTAHELHTKYIKVNAKFEINISAEWRGKYRILDEGGWDMGIKDMMTGFVDDVIQEMQLFMMDSFVRLESEKMY